MRERRGARRARHVIARWRLREATLVFGAWRGEVERGRRVWERAGSAAARMLRQGVARAFSTWEGARRARAEARHPLEPSPLTAHRSPLTFHPHHHHHPTPTPTPTPAPTPTPTPTLTKALQRVGGASRKWFYPRAACAWRTWVHQATQRRQLRRAAAAVLLRGSRLALNQWCSHTRARLQVLRRVRASVGAWRERELSRAMRSWASAAGLRPTALSMPRHKQRASELSLDELAGLMALGCWKRGRHTGRWRRVHLSLRETGLAYSKTGADVGAGGRTPQRKAKGQSERQGERLSEGESSPRLLFSYIEQVRMQSRESIPTVTVIYLLWPRAY